MACRFEDGETKGVETLIEAIGQMSEHKDVQIVLCDALEPDDSASARHEKLAELITNQGLKGRVHFARVTYRNMPSAMRSADVVVVPSTIAEGGWAQTMIEAMASGKPVISTGSPDPTRTFGGQDEAIRLAYGERAQDVIAEPGSPTDLASKMSNLLNNSELQQDLTERGLAATRGTMSWETSMDGIELLYGSVGMDISPRQELSQPQTASRSI